VASGREVRHGGPDFGHQRFRHACANPWNGVEAVDRLGQKRVGTLLKLAWNLCGRAGYRLI
jgi:hypothetical protein